MHDNRMTMTVWSAVRFTIPGVRLTSKLATLIVVHLFQKSRCSVMLATVDGVDIPHLGCKGQKHLPDGLVVFTCVLQS